MSASQCPLTWCVLAQCVPRTRARELNFGNVLMQEANLPRVTIPFLVLHGAADQVTDPLVSKALYAEASSTDKTIKLYDGAWHALAGGEPEPLASQIRKDEVDWLLARAQGAGAPAAATATATPASAGSGESKGEPQGANSTSSSQHEGDVLLSIQQ